MEFSLLADDPGASEIVAGWYFDEWCRDSGRYSEDAVRTKVMAATNRDCAPLLVLAKDNNALVGAAEFKIREMDAYPQYEHWVGGVYVAPSHRGRGLAAQLVRDVMARARQAGVGKLYLQTEALNGGLYATLGFTPIEEADSKGVRVLVMVAELG